ncbi:uncharacterized protein LOC111241699 isoform X2 [Vigna radiata var. radiata]|uniref:Uncharacterized protein LOC111241699 isoform X2 n=1 Tax=Vigna radiata var. radiata TaxID=3916 RepID=A0A3Q0F340_VIGRR|nr:uncharacterized protein LOC111241699 isoform X2 [Vigna radiata var. radiata]
MKFHFGSFVVHFHFELSLLFVSSIRLHLSNSLHSPFGFHLIRRPHFNQNKSSFTIILLSFNGFQKPKGIHSGAIVQGEIVAGCINCLWRRRGGSRHN